MAGKKLHAEQIMVASGRMLTRFQRYGMFLLLAVVSVTCAEGALLVSDEFAASVYGPDGSLIDNNNGGTGWAADWGVFGGVGFKFDSAGLTYPGYGGTEGLAFGVGSTLGNARDYNFTSSATTLYYSFLATMDVASGSSDNSIAQFLDTGLGQGNAGWVVQKRTLEDNWTFTARPAPGGGAQTHVDTGFATTTDTTLFVARIDLNTGGSGEDTLKLYVNPTAGSEPLVADAEITTVDIGINFAAINQFRFLKAENTTSMEIDEIRVAEFYFESFLDAAVPEPSTFALAAVGVAFLLACTRPIRQRF